MKRGYGSGKRVVTPEMVQQPPGGPAPGGARLTPAERAIRLRECNERIGAEWVRRRLAALNASLPPTSDPLPVGPGKITWRGNELRRPDDCIWLGGDDGETPALFSDWADLRAFCEFILSLDA